MDHQVRSPSPDLYSPASIGFTDSDIARIHRVGYTDSDIARIRRFWYSVHSVNFSAYLTADTPDQRSVAFDYLFNTLKRNSEKVGSEQCIF